MIFASFAFGRFYFQHFFSDIQGLESFPQRDIIAKQMRGFSGMITVYLRCTGEQTKTFITNLKVIALPYMDDINVLKEL